MAAVGRQRRGSSLLKTGVDGIKKPADGFEPTAFALQKRCSTTELSRQWGNFTGAHLLQGLSLLHPPERELQPGLAAGFVKRAADVTLYRPNADQASCSDRTVAHALEQQVENRDFCWREIEIGHALGVTVVSIPPERLDRDVTLMQRGPRLLRCACRQ